MLLPNTTDFGDSEAPVEQLEPVLYTQADVEAAREEGYNRGYDDGYENAQADSA
jgi:hypothetical protein